MLTNLNETNRSRGTLTNNMGHGARSLQAKSRKHNDPRRHGERDGVGGSAGGALARAAPLIPAQQCAQSALDRTTYLLRCGALPHPGGKYLTGVNVSAVARGGPTTMTVARRSVGRRPRAVYRRLAIPFPPHLRRPWRGRRRGNCGPARAPPTEGGGRDRAEAGDPRGRRASRRPPVLQASQRRPAPTHARRTGQVARTR